MKTPYMEGTYEPPISTDSPALLRAWSATLQLAPGVRGFAYELGDEIWIPLILAELKGSGDVGRFLDKLSPRCVVVDVTSARLECMLRRRGWKKHLGKENDVWRRSK